MNRKNIKERIQAHFFQHPTERLRVRQIERKTGASLPSVIVHVEELTKEGILRREEIAGVVLFSAARTSEQYLLDKRLYNLRQLHESGLIHFLRKEYHNPTILLFGSYARGEDTEESDIDLYIESATKISLPPKFSQALGRKIQIFQETSVETMAPELANNVVNGIVLNGFLEVFR